MHFDLYPKYIDRIRFRIYLSEKSFRIRNLYPKKRFCSFCAFSSDISLLWQSRSGSFRIFFRSSNWIYFIILKYRSTWCVRWEIIKQKMFSRSEIDHLTLNCHVIEYKCITCDWCGHLVTSYFTPRSISFSFLRLQSRFIFTLSEVGTRDGLTLQYNFETIFFIFSTEENEIIYVLYWNKCWFITKNNRKRFAQTA